MVRRCFTKAMLTTLFITCFPVISQSGEAKFCSTLKSIIENGSERHKKFRGAQILNDADGQVWKGLATFGSVNDCTIYVFPNGSQYECSSGKFDSDSQKIHLLWASIAKLTHECLQGEAEKWVGRENTENKKTRATHSFEFANLESNTNVTTKLIEKKRPDEPSMWKAEIVILQRQ